MGFFDFFSSLSIMSIYTDIETMHTEMRHWRQHFHQFPETAFEEINTSQFISSKLKSFGLNSTGKTAKTGVRASNNYGLRKVDPSLFKKLK